MPPEFLNRLSVSDEERSKLTSLGAPSALALLSMRKASKESFDAFLGEHRAGAIAAELETLLSDEELRRLKTESTPPGHMGARLGKPPGR